MSQAVQFFKASWFCLAVIFGGFPFGIAVSRVIADEEPAKPEVISPPVIDDLLEDFDLEHANQMSPVDFLPDGDWLQSAPARDRTRYLSAVKRILKAILAGKSSDREHLAKTFDEAQRLCDSDPRLPLAYGLSLQRMGESGLAQSVFEQAAEGSGRNYLPLLQAATMSQLMNHDYRKARTALQSIATVLSQREASRLPSQAFRAHLADWLGATANWLAAVPEATESSPGMDLASLRSTLPQSWRDAFDNGQARSERQLSELRAFSAETAGDSTQKLKAARTKISEKLQADQAAVKTLQEELRRRSTEFHAAHQVEKSLRSELHRLNEQRQQHAEEVAELSQPRVYTEVKMQTRTVRRARMQVPVEVQRQENATERTDRLSKLQVASTALTNAESRIDSVKERLEHAKNDRQTLSVQVRQQTTEEQKQLAQLQSETRALERLRDRLNRLAAEPDKLAERLRSPEILLDWDIDELAGALLASFEQASKEKSAAR